MVYIVDPTIRQLSLFPPARKKKKIMMKQLILASTETKPWLRWSYQKNPSPAMPPRETASHCRAPLQRPHRSRASWGEDVEETQGRRDCACPLLKHRGEAKGLSWDKQHGSSSLSPCICRAARAGALLLVGPRDFTGTFAYLKSCPNSLPRKTVCVCAQRLGPQLCSQASPTDQRAVHN